MLRRPRVLVPTPLLIPIAVVGLWGCEESMAPMAQPGSIEVTSPALVGHMGLTFLVFADDAAWTMNPQASFCEQIGSDPATITGTIAQSLSQPCDLGADFEFDPGTYFVFGGLFTPGGMAPMECTEAQVTVDGDVSVTLPALSAANCP